MGSDPQSVFIAEMGSQAGTWEQGIARPFGDGGHFSVSGEMVSSTLALGFSISLSGVVC